MANAVKVVSKTKKKSKAVVADDLPKKTKVAEQVGFNVRSYFDDAMDMIEKKTKISSRSVAMRGARLSTGLLALDMYLGGGLVPGSWTTLSGGEQSCKSTTAMSIMAQVIKTKFAGLCGIFDFEGSSDANYIANMLATSGVDIDPKLVFGIPDPDGGWIVPPMIRYYAPDNGEAFFDHMSMSRRRLPDKIVEEDGTAYLLFENTKENKKIVGDKYDKKWFSKKNQYKVLAADDQMQMLVLVDSYPAMLPDQVDDDDGSKAMALQARMFSDGIKRFRGGMRRKMMTILGINQLRQRPATMFGSPEYEPCGDALKFYCFDSETLINLSDGRRMTAPQINEALTSGETISVETSHGFVPVMKSWKVAEDKQQFEIVAGSVYSYTGSDTHRQLVFKKHYTKDSFEAFVPEWKTLHDLCLLGERNSLYAALRFQPVEELGEVPTEEIDFEIELRKATVDLDYVSSFTIGFSETILRAPEVSDKEISEYLQRFGLIHYVEQTANGSNFIIPALSDDEVKTALDLRASISSAMQNRQREALYIYMLQDVCPELIAFCTMTECNMLNIAHVTTMLDKALAWELTDLEEYFQQEFNTTYDTLHRQLAYIEEYYEFGDNLVPLPYTVRATEGAELWDVTVPCTGTVVTDRLVSHNSDVRIRLVSRAVPAAFEKNKMKDRPGSVAEKSVTVEDGMDIYRFIAAKTIKNKMGGIPNQSTWLRLWESDGNGEARGFDPVFDTWHFLHTLKLIAGSRNKIKFKDPVPMSGGKAIDWDDFRILILGTKKEIKEVCEAAGIKSGDLRKWCFKYLNSEAGKQRVKDSIVKAASKGAKDDDDGDDE